MEIINQLATIPIGSYTTWGFVVLASVSGIIQISPIHLDPWSALARIIGRAINKEVIDKVDCLENDVSELRKIGDKREKEEGERNAKSCRLRILRFGDEARHKQRHSKEHWDDIMQDITDYESYCATHKDFKNQKAQSTINLLVREYERCLSNNDFLE